MHSPFSTVSASFQLWFSFPSFYLHQFFFVRATDKSSFWRKNNPKHAKQFFFSGCCCCLYCLIRVLVLVFMRLCLCVSMALLDYKLYLLALNGKRTGLYNQKIGWTANNISAVKQPNQTKPNRTNKSMTNHCQEPASTE